MPIRPGPTSRSGSCRSPGAAILFLRTTAPLRIRQPGPRLRSHNISKRQPRTRRMANRATSCSTHSRPSKLKAVSIGPATIKVIAVGQGEVGAGDFNTVLPGAEQFAGDGENASRATFIGGLGLPKGDAVIWEGHEPFGKSR